MESSRQWKKIAEEIILRRMLLGALAGSTAPAADDDWLNRQIKLVIPYPPGGPTDISTRLVIEKAGHMLGQPVLFGK